MFLLYVVFTLVHMRFQQYTFIKDTHYCKDLMQTNKLSYAGAGSEINSRGHNNFHWHMNQINIKTKLTI